MLGVVGVASITLIIMPIRVDVVEMADTSALSRYLLHDEIVRFKSMTPVTYAGMKYYLFLTNYRLILYMRRGLVFKKDDIISERLEDVVKIGFRERGLISRTGIITVDTKTRKIEISGAAESMRALYMHLQELITRK